MDAILKEWYERAYSPRYLSEERMQIEKARFDRAEARFDRAESRLEQEQQSHRRAVLKFKDFLSKVSPQDLFQCILSTWGRGTYPDSVREFYALLVEVTSKEFRGELLVLFRQQFRGPCAPYPDSDIATWIGLLSEV